MSTSAIWVILMLFLVPIALWVNYYDNKSRTNNLKAFGEKYNGSVTGAGIFSLASLNIPYKDNTLIVTFTPPSRASGGSSDYSASLTLSEPHFPEFTLGTNSILQKAIGNYGSDRILTGDERFDFLFIVRGQDRSVVMKVLTEEIREKLKNKPFDMPSFIFKPTSFSISTPVLGYSKQRSDAKDVFISTIISLLDAAWI